MSRSAAQVLSEYGRPEDAPDIEGRHTNGSITDRIAGLVLERSTGPGFWIALGVTGALAVIFVVSLIYLLVVGTGIWGLNNTEDWGFMIASYVWWIAIGNSGTFISAFLLLLRQRWRTSINRFAEAMTLFAVAMAGLMPIMHLGRPWFFYWLAPYPDKMSLWPQWRSPLEWDFFANTTYLILSILFWYLGLLPDLATMRDQARRRWQRISYGLMALGWRGDARHWHHYESAYRLLAGLGAPLVISVHSVVSIDFAFADLPGWHSTIFPPYFIGGALYSGIALAITITIALRAIFGLQDFITPRHLANLAKLMLACSFVLTYTYAAEMFTAFYSGDHFEIYTAMDRLVGHYAFTYWLAIFCNVIVPQSIWFRRVRASPLALFIVTVIINIGMWDERFMIIVTSLHRSFLPSSWHTFVPTFWDWSTLIGSLGAFVLLFLLFARFFPVISMAELRRLNARTAGEDP
ncbi:MAG TPA: NrfD/PsrC family molybdoenzyme membrane anchor subunit [Steroidobacteraceae bacterium]